MSIEEIVCIGLKSFSVVWWMKICRFSFSSTKDGLSIYIYMQQSSWRFVAWFCFCSNNLQIYHVRNWKWIDPKSAPNINDALWLRTGGITRRFLFWLNYFECCASDLVDECALGYVVILTVNRLHISPGNRTPMTTILPHQAKRKKTRSTYYGLLWE